MRIAVDVGGTFTDVIVLDEETNTLRLEKVETTPQDPATGVLQSFEKANARLPDIDYFVHGTTLGLNALLTRTGARVAIVTTNGFRDIYELGRTARDLMYDFKYRKPKTLWLRSRISSAANIGNTNAPARQCSPGMTEGVVFVIPAKAGIQERGILFLSSVAA